MPTKPNAANNEMNLALANPEAEPDENDLTYGLSDFGVETQDGIAHRTQAEAEVRNILTSFRPRVRRLESTSTVYIDLYDGGVKEVVGIPIRSISGDVLNEMSKGVVVPEVPMKKDSRTGEIVEDRGHRDYKKVHADTLELQYRFRCLKMLHGLDMDVYDVDSDIVVWARDRSVQDVDAAIETIRAMGLSTHHLNTINDEIDRISGLVQQVETEDLEKKS